MRAMPGAMCKRLYNDGSSRCGPLAGPWAISSRPMICHTRVADIKGGQILRAPLHARPAGTPPQPSHPGSCGAKVRSDMLPEARVTHPLAVLASPGPPPFHWRRTLLALAVAAMGVVDLLSALLSNPPDRL